MIVIPLDNTNLKKPSSTEGSVQMFWIREHFFAIEMNSDVMSYAIFRLKDGSRIG
jgi:hypothetical protein